MIAAAMAARLPPGRQLQSWKEIAAYFGVTERTVQNWERERGLPVHRVAGEKGRVVAWTEELDRWRASMLDRPSWWVSLRFWRFLGVSAGLLVAAVAVVASVMGWAWMRRGPPTRFTLDERSLIVTDDRGREVWRYLFDEPFARGITPSELLHLRLAAFADLDADGQNELLFVYRPASYTARGDTLICFSGRGRPLWRYQVTKTVSTPGEVFGPPFLAGFLLVLPPGRDGTRNIAFASHHLSYYPAQLALLTHRGELRSEYWHSGHILFGETAELEEPRRNAILLAAISNSYRTSSLIVLDPDSRWCASNESEHPMYQLSPPERNCELARIVFPRTCISRKFDPYSKPLGLVVHPDWIQFGTEERSGHTEVATIFRFDLRLKLQSAEVVDAFLAHHRELEASGQLDHSFSPAEARSLEEIRILRHWRLPSALPDGSFSSDSRRR